MYVGKRGVPVPKNRFAPKTQRLVEKTRGLELDQVQIVPQRPARDGDHAEVMGEQDRLEQGRGAGERLEARGSTLIVESLEDIVADEGYRLRPIGIIFD